MSNYTVYLTHRTSNKVLRKVVVQARDEFDAMNGVVPTRWERVYGAVETPRSRAVAGVARSFGGGW